MSKPAVHATFARRADRAFTLFVWSCGILGLLLPFSMAVYLLYHGGAAVSWSFVTEGPGGFPLGSKGGVQPAIAGSVLLASVGLAVAFPLALAGAVWLAEYAPPGRTAGLIQFANECFASMPSIVYGLFGYSLLVVYLKLKMSLLAGGLTLGIMMLPMILVGSYSAIRAVGWRSREAALSLGVSRWYVFARVVLPLAWPGILASTVLAVGYAVGAAAPVLFTASVYFARGTPGLNSPVMTLPTHLYYLVGDSVSLRQAYATAFLLVSGLLCFNVFALLLRKWSTREA